MKKILIILSVMVFVGCDKAPAKPDYFSKKLADVELAYKQRPEDINKPDEDDTTPLITAIIRDNVEIAKFLIDKGADVTYVPSNKDWGTALGYAVSSSKDYHELIDLLIQNGADINTKDSIGETPLLHGLHEYKTVNIKNIEYILEHGADANISNNDGITPLLAVATREQDTSNIINILIKHGALLNKECPGNASILMYCAKFNAHINNVKTLIENGENVNLHFDDGWTSLMEAVKNTNTKLIKLLSDNKADVNAATETGATALIFAASSDKDNSEIIELLLKYGADINQRDNNGGTALWAAANFGHINNVKTLLEHKADTTLYPNENWPILLVAIDKNNKEMVNILLKHGCNPDVKADNNGPSALMLAAGRNNYELVKILTEHGANINEAGEFGTALTIASAMGYFDIVKYLVDHGADVNVVDSEKWTPLIIAADKGYLAIVKYLTEHGANIDYDLIGDLVNEDKDFPIRWTALNKAIQRNHLDVAKYLISKGASLEGIVMAANMSFDIDTMRYVANISTDKSVKKLKKKLQTCDTFMGYVVEIISRLPEEQQKLIADSNYFEATNLYVYLYMLPHPEKLIKFYGTKTTNTDLAEAFLYTVNELDYRNLLFAKATEESIKDIVIQIFKSEEVTLASFKSCSLKPDSRVSLSSLTISKGNFVISLISSRASIFEVEHIPRVKGDSDNTRI